MTMELYTHLTATHKKESGQKLAEYVERVAK